MNASTTTRPTEVVATQEFDSPVGRLMVSAVAQGVVSVDWVDKSQERPLRAVGEDADSRGNESAAIWCSEAIKQLGEYFRGERTRFDLPLVVQGTAFQRAVWKALEQIPYGETRSYQDIARQIGRDKAVRAVGQANRANPIPIVIPCHRVIGANGQLTGYAGSKVHLKAALLSLEQSLGGLAPVAATGQIAVATPPVHTSPVE
uniref:methylated-DNA--[protein]-cysteine S-methyltransferase n=1 Tax=Alicyclobacillus tolerans TaxID=90970 RepID=UPI0027E204A2|nr:methylated-DNA--[protein]-cysteine S-methyltransferase [Alicyclobacillus tolerans]